MNKSIKELQKFTRNTGEIITHQILVNLKKELSDKLKEAEMSILPNIFIPYEEKGVIKTRQIDHLVILPMGIYVIETKYWAGKVVHGVTSKNGGVYSFIPEMMGPLLSEIMETH